MNLKHLLAASIAASFCHATFAAPTYYAFAGLVDINHTDHADLGTFTGTFSFESSQPDLVPDDPHEGYYPMSGAHGMNVAFQDGTQLFTDPTASYTFSVHLPQDSASDQVTDHAHFDIEGRVQGEIDRFIGLSFRKDFVTDALPGADGDLHLADFDQVEFFFAGLTEIAPDPDHPGPPPFGARGHLTALSCIDGCIDVVGPTPTAIPEPSTVALLFAALALPGLRLGRRTAAARARHTTERARRSAICVAS